MDSQFDSTITGKPVKILSIADEHTRECLGGIVHYSTTRLDLVEQRELSAIDRGMPGALRTDTGPELISNALADWAGETKKGGFIPPGQAWKNGHVESFNGKLQEEYAYASTTFTPPTTPKASSDSGRKNTTLSGHTDPSDTQPQAFTTHNAPIKNHWQFSELLDLEQ